MIDAPDVLHGYLAAQGDVVTTFGTRIWPERTTAATGYRPTQGAALAFRSRTESVDYSSALLYNSWQCKVYGSDEKVANAAYRVLVAALHDAQGDGLVSSLLENKAGTLVEPGTNFDYVLCFFETWMRAQITA